MDSAAQVFDVMEPSKGHLDCGDGIGVPLEESSISLSVFRRQLQKAPALTCLKPWLLLPLSLPARLTPQDNPWAENKCLGQELSCNQTSYNKQTQRLMEVR